MEGSEHSAFSTQPSAVSIQLLALKNAKKLSSWAKRRTCCFRPAAKFCVRDGAVEREW